MKRVLALILTLALALCGCGGTAEPAVPESAAAPETAAPPVSEEPLPEAAEPVPEEVPVAGWYELTSVSEQDSVLDLTDLDLMGINSSNTYLVIHEDETTGILALFDGFEMYFTLTDSELQLEGETAPYTLENGVFTLTLSGRAGEQVVFTWAGASMPELPRETAETEEGSFALPVTARLGEHELTVLAAERIPAEDGSPAIRIYYEFTNRSDGPASAWEETLLQAFQDGEELEPVFAAENAAEFGNDLLRVMPGVTIRCTAEFGLRSEEAEVEFTAGNLWGEDSLAVRLDPKNLPGPPEDVYEILPVPDPDWTEGLPRTGTDVDILQYEFLEDVTGAPMIRLWFEYTNNAGEMADSFLFATELSVMQDGVELEHTEGADPVTEDLNWMTAVAVEEGITVALCYRIRSESPITLLLTEMHTGEVIGLLIPVDAAG